MPRRTVASSGVARICAFPFTSKTGGGGGSARWAVAALDAVRIRRTANAIRFILDLISYVEKFPYKTIRSQPAFLRRFNHLVGGMRIAPRLHKGSNVMRRTNLWLGNDLLGYRVRNGA